MATKSSSKSAASQGKSGQSYVSTPTKSPASQGKSGQSYVPTKPSSGFVSASIDKVSLPKSFSPSPAPASKVQSAPRFAGSLGSGTLSAAKPASTNGKTSISVAKSINPYTKYDTRNNTISLPSPSRVDTVREMGREANRAAAFTNLNKPAAQPAPKYAGPAYRSVAPTNPMLKQTMTKFATPRLSQVVNGEDPKFNDFSDLDSPNPFGDTLGYKMRMAEADGYRQTPTRIVDGDFRRLGPNMKPKPDLADYKANMVANIADAKAAKDQSRFPQDPNYTFKKAGEYAPANRVALRGPASSGTYFDTSAPAARSLAVAKRNPGSGMSFTPDITQIMDSEAEYPPMAAVNDDGSADRVASLARLNAAIGSLPGAYKEAHDEAYNNSMYGKDVVTMPDGSTFTTDGTPAGAVPGPGGGLKKMGVPVDQSLYDGIAPTAAPAKTIFNQPTPQHQLYGGDAGPKEPLNGPWADTARYAGLGSLVDGGNWLANLPSPQPGAAQSLDSTGTYINKGGIPGLGSNGSSASGALAALAETLAQSVPEAAAPATPVAAAAAPAATSGALQSIYKPPIDYYRYGFNPEPQMFSNNSIG